MRGQINNRLELKGNFCNKSLIFSTLRRNINDRVRSQRSIAKSKLWQCDLRLGVRFASVRKSPNLITVSSFVPLCQTMISIFGIPVIMEFEKPLMKHVIGKKIVVWGFLVMSFCHLPCLVMAPYGKMLEAYFKSGMERHTLLNLGVKDMLTWLCLYAPPLTFYAIRLKGIKPFLLRSILEDQSLATAFKEVHDDPDLERATPQVVGTEMHSVATWLLTKSTLLFCALGCLIIYKEYRYIPMVSQLPVSWFVTTSGFLFYFCYDMNYEALQFATKRMEKILGTDT